MTLTVGDVLADRVRRYRKAKGLSIRQLAVACTDAGRPSLTEASLTNIERNPGKSSSRGRRAMAVEELLTLAYVLEVPPVLLLLPVGEPDGTAGLSGPIEILPGLSVDAAAALSWINGEIDVPDAAFDHTPSDRWRQNARPLDLLQQIVERSRIEYGLRTRLLTEKDPERRKALRELRDLEDAALSALLEIAPGFGRPARSGGASDE